MEKPDGKSEDLGELKGKDTIELAAPSSTNVPQLLGFVCRLEERFHSDYHSAGIVQTLAPITGALS